MSISPLLVVSGMLVCACIQMERGGIDAAAVSVLNAHGRIVGPGMPSRQSAGQRTSGGGRLGIGIK